MRAIYSLVAAAALALYPVTTSADPFSFSTNSPDGLMGVASRPDTANNEIEAADDFILNSETIINHLTFTGLIPSNVTLPAVQRVDVTFYRVFPLDSNSVRTPLVPTRTNSPSDVEFDGRSSADSNMTFNASILNSTFNVNNSILNGIHPSPNQTTGGEGAISGQEVLFDITLTTPIDLLANHYFLVPQVQLSSGNFFWLSAPKPIVSPGTPFTGDLQAWTRNTALDPDWLRAGTDIVGGATPPTFNMTFSLSGTAVPEPGTLGVTLLGALLLWRRNRRN